MLHLHGIGIINDFLPLQLESSDVILRMQWLETLGMTHTNWKTHIMKFNIEKDIVTLRGDPSLGCTLVSLKAMKKCIRREQDGMLVELAHIEGHMEEENGEPEFL